MKKILLLMSVALVSVGCSGWLDDAKPTQFSEEEELFSRETGFKEALTGAYQLAAKSNLYGSRLTFDYMDKLGQRYRYVNNSGSLVYQQPSFYEFDAKASTDITDVIWRDMYAVIANLNNLLGYLESNREVLTTPDYYEIIKGEALALRSYLYFDLLRMFGPIYAKHPQAKSIVYRTEFNRDEKDLLPANEVLGYIIDDLESAYDLLEDTDTMDFEYVNKIAAEVDEDPFLVFRQNRMNALAVQALLARVHLYAGNTGEAMEYAENVIGSGKVTLNRDNSQDHVMSSEVIFGVHVDKMEENVSEKITATSQWVVNDPTEAFFNELMHIADGANDNRIRNGFVREGASTTVYFLSSKFDQRGLSHSMTGMMPLLRLSEMYYIMTECTGDVEWLNDVRDARAILPLPAFSDNDAMMDALGIEYRKEFYGEGQLWYFYKRTVADKDRFFNMSNIFPGGIEDRHYQFNVPDNEYLFGGLSKDE